MNISKAYRNIMIVFAFALFASNSFAFSERAANLETEQTKIRDIRGPR